MRKIFRDVAKTNQLYSNGEDFATKDDLAKVVVQVNNTIEQLTLLSQSLQAYKEANQEEIVTEALNAVNATIDALDATAANLDDVDANTITVSSLAKITQLEAQIAQITTSLTAPEANITDLTSLRVNIGNGTFTSLTGASIAVQSWSAENFNINNMAVSNKITANEIEATTSSVGDAEANSLAVTNDISVGGKVEVQGNISTEAVVIADAVKSSNIEWKDKTTITNASLFYVEVPHFENGMYALSFSNNGVTYATLEIFNSIDNFFVRWSQSATGFIGNIYKVGSDSNAQLYLQIINTDEIALDLKYGVISKSENVPAPETYSSMPVSALVVYPVVMKDGQKFFKNVDLANQGTTVGTLTMTQSDLYTTADTTAKSYDTTENVTRKIYKPNQSLNTTDDVTFNTVEAPFLNIADIDVQSKLKSKNIYNGPELSSAQIDSLEDDTLYIPQNSTSGTTVAGASLHNDNWTAHRNNGPVEAGEIHYYGSTFAKTVDGQTFIVDEYPPQQGYSLDPNPVSILHVVGESGNAGNRFWHALVVNNRTNKKYILQPYGYYEPDWYIYDVDDLDVGGSGTKIAEIHEPIYTDATMINSPNWGSRDQFSYYNDGYNNSYCPVEGEVFYINSSNPAVVGEYAVIYPHVCVRTTAGIAYTKGGIGGSIFRKTTKSDNTQLLPIVPYAEVSTEQTPVDDNHPLVYNSTKDAIEKSTGDITIDGDLAVGGDATITGDVSADNATLTGDLSADNITATGDATIGGDTTVTGALEAGSIVSAGDTVIHGDLYVDGTTHTTTEESISTTGDVIVLRQNNNTTLGATYAGIVVNKYNGTNELALVTNSDGELRVGTGTGTDTVYPNIYWDDDTSKWYSDAACTTEVTPAGNLISWGSVEQLGNVKHYVDAVFNQITFSGLVPLLARDEATNIPDHSILEFDRTSETAKAIASPVNNNFLQAHVNSGADYHWSAITFDATGYAQMLYAFPTNDDTPFMDLELKQGTKPTPIPAEATTVTHSYNDFKYYTETEKIVSYDSVADKYYEVFFNKDGTCWVDDSTPTIVDPQYLVDCTISSEKIDNVHETRYSWEPIVIPEIPQVFTFATMADYNAAASTVPNGSTVIITGETNYVLGQ